MDRGRRRSRTSRSAAIDQGMRPGFEPTDSTPFDVRGGEAAQVLLDIDSTFVAESLEVRAPTHRLRAFSRSRPAT